MEKSLTFIVDTRNQKDAFVVEGLQALGHKVLRSKLPFGDVALSTNILNCIDLKSSGGGLIELAKNRMSRDHDRMKSEIVNCKDAGGKITFMCFEEGVTCIDEIATKWQVPKFKSDLYEEYVDDAGGKHKRLVARRRGMPMWKGNPVSLMKSLKTMTEQDHYGEGFKVDLVFATKANCARKIIKILTKED